MGFWAGFSSFSTLCSPQSGPQAIWDFCRGLFILLYVSSPWSGLTTIWKGISTVRRCNIPVSIFFNLTQFSSLKFHYYVFQNNPQKTTFMYCYASLNSEYNTLWPFWRMFPHPLYIMYYLVYFFMLFWNGLPITNILISK